MRLKIVGFTHPGAVRPVNQDTIGVAPAYVSATAPEPVEFTFTVHREAPLVALVADGLGGHAAGEVASRIAAETILARLPRVGDDATASVASAVAAANLAIYAHMNRSPDLTGMGSTVAGILMWGEELVVFNVGDSRVYRWQDGFLSKLSTDDAVAGERRGAILQCLGGARTLIEVAPHIVVERWRPGRAYLICSDGLYDALSADALEAALAQTPLAAAWTLLEGALDANARDNVSAVWIVPDTA